MNQFLFEMKRKIH